MKGGLGSIVASRNFMLYLSAQFFTCIGDAFQAVAIAILIFNLTGSGLSAGFSIIFPPMSSILASTFAGSLGDRFPEKRLLIIFGISKGLFIMLFVVARQLWLCYLLIFLLSLINVLYGIPGRKITVNILPGQRLLMGNSILNGLSGAVFFFGPAAAGLAIRNWSVDSALFISGSCYILSSLFLPFLSLQGNRKSYFVMGGYGSSLLTKIKDGYRYCMRNKEIKETILSYSAISLCAASVNMAFYPYSFDILKVNPYQLGVIISVFNGVALLSMAFMIFAGKKLHISFNILVFLPCFFVAAAWISYSLVRSFHAALLLLALEGTSYFFSITFLTTKLQLSSERDFLARVLGTNELFVNVARLLGICASCVIMLFSDVLTVFVINSAALFVFAFLGLCRTAWIKDVVLR